MTSTQHPPLPQPPFFSIPNIQNLRDAAQFPGGLPTSSGGKVRPGVLFRSAEVSKLDQDGWRQVKSIGVGHVFDLRSKPEVIKGWAGVTGEPGKDVRPGWIEALEAEGLQRTWVPVFEESDYSPERLAERYSKYMGETVEGFVQAYHDILVHAGPSYKTILLYLANLPSPGTAEGKEIGSRGALIHCTAGKDRTGIFFGVLFAFLGVPAQIIAEEYNLTETGLAHIRDEIVGRLMQSPGVRNFVASQVAGKGLDTAELAKVLDRKEEDGKNGKEVVVPEVLLERARQAALRMAGASRESMIESLKMVEREWGSAEGYFRSVCGFGDQELERLRKALVVEDGR